MNYYIITFGCQMNHSDSERIASVLEKAKYKKAPKIEGADLIVVNMCSIRRSAVDKVHGVVAKFKKLQTKNYKLKTVLTGCILKKDRKKFAEKFDLIFDIKDLPNWLKSLKNTKNYFKIKPKYQNKFSACIPIMTGCNNFCSYCVVPYTRDREFSRPAKDILNEIRNLIKHGYKEVWLLGQNVNSYKSKIQNPNYSKSNLKSKCQNQKFKIINFAKLLKMVNDIPGDFWIRFTSSHPKDFSAQLINSMAKCEKNTPYLNLPFQSGDDKILKKMNRNYTVKEYKKLIKKIRKKNPDITLSTDIIVGFPGETKKQFENTVKLFKEIKFDMAYISRYSPRPETSALKLKDNVSLREKKKRKEILNNILKKIALEKNKKYIGKIVNVLVEKQKNEFLIGKSRHYKTVKFESNKNLIGKFVKVKITDALSWGLKGKLIQKK
ncbi:tRNA (N6-isopentenyl adenosine(37)-C2)-methylthiotransferase MiaB [Candidatus Parcubacteria bacterium]|nr:tRNA (N6-isopentenyl adenosine(37)-C2)-methylthiotransferase MiaB [Candidatus Parcubacteria bacterium]